MAFFTYPPNESQNPGFTNVSVTRADIPSASTINALSSDTSYVKFTGSTATTLNGITAGRDGQILMLWNNTGQNMTVTHESASASAANRIVTATGSNFVTTGNGSAFFIYDAGLSRWMKLAGNA
jgi:hypothetical protein